MAGSCGKVLKIEKKFINKSNRELVKDFSKSIFYDVYKNAYKELIDIVETQEELKEEIRPRNFDANNIIAFVGERGCGKTSCMKNFRRSFKNDKYNVKSGIFGFNYNEKKKMSCRYEVLSVIDPSLFSVQDSIIEMVVAQMFNRFREKDKDNDSEYYSEKNIIMLFEKVYKDIRIINTNKRLIYDRNCDSLEALVSLSSAIALKEDLSELVSKYVKYMTNGEEGYLLICIDDINMSLSVGEKMLEDIRKYLIIPNVIILMAVNIEQLREIVIQKYLCYLRENEALYNRIDNLDNKGTKLLDDFRKKIEFRAEKYLEKIIPFNRRICINKLNLKKFSIKYEDGQEEETIPYLINLFNESMEIKIDTMEEIKKIQKDFSENKMVNLGNAMSRILEDKNKDDKDKVEQCIEILIPTNLRTFESLIVLLNNLKEKDENNEVTPNVYKNIYKNKEMLKKGEKDEEKQDEEKQERIARKHNILMKFYEVIDKELELEK